MQVPLLDLKAQYPLYKEEVMSEISEIAAAQYFINGPKVEKAEKELAEYTNADYALGVSSGSDALIISLMGEDIGAGDEVICPSFTFFATAGAIHRVGAKPVYCDIEESSFNLDPAKLEESINEKTKAIIVVHLYGQMADMDAIMEIANKHNLIVIEDAAQAIGAMYKGRMAGTIGDYGCFSFFPSKNLGCFGDGGLVTTNDEAKYKKIKSLRNHGSDVKYFHDYIGGNFRLDAIQAAVVSCKLPHLDTWHQQRAANADYYREKFAEAGLSEAIILPLEAAGTTRHVYNQFCIRVANGKRDQLFDALREQGVGCDIYYPKPLHLQDCFSDLGYKDGDLPITEKLTHDIMAIPIYPELTREQQDYVVRTIKSILEA
jgi:dTDP-4-amino-4,6-dideoxygalactose transaminase